MKITQEQSLKLNVIKLAFEKGFVIINAREHNKMEVFTLNEIGLFKLLDLALLSKLGLIKLSKEELEMGYIKSQSHTDVWFALTTAILNNKSEPISDLQMYKKFGTCYSLNSELHNILEYIREVEKSEKYKDFLAEIDKLKKDEHPY